MIIYHSINALTLTATKSCLSTLLALSRDSIVCVLFFPVEHQSAAQGESCICNFVLKTKVTRSVYLSCDSTGMGLWVSEFGGEAESWQPC